MATVTEAHKRLIELDLPRRGELVVDLRDVTFMDSTGIRLLLFAREHARRCGASLVIVRGPDEVMRVLELVGLDDQLDIAAPVEQV
jgi:anti-anti-sigma factor